MLDWTPIKGKSAIRFAFVSIGALLVGSNVFTNAKPNLTAQRGKEMGYFAYGGSTCIAVFPPEAKVKWDEDLLTNSNKGVSRKPDRFVYMISQFLSFFLPFLGL